MTGPAFRLPAPPARWSGADLVRLVDPTGSAIAWLAPEAGAACVAYLVRVGDDAWRKVGGGVGETPAVAGIAIDGQATTWRLAVRDPTSCRLEREGAFGRLEVWLADSRLWLEVEIEAGQTVSIDFGAPVPISVEGAADDVVIGAGSCSFRAAGLVPVRVG